MDNKENKKWYEKTVTIVIGVIVLLTITLTVSYFILENIKGSNSDYSTTTNGIHIVGIPPSEYGYGGEEFETESNGTYTVGIDIEAGSYDFEVISGEGTLTTSYGLDVQLDTDKNNLYENAVLLNGDVIETNDVELKLIPQSNDTMFIPEGTYDVKATGSLDTEGGYVVQDRSSNAIIATGVVADETDSTTQTVELETGDMITIEGATLDFDIVE